VTSMSSKLEPAIWSRNTGQRIPWLDRCHWTTTWMSNIKGGFKVALYSFTIARALRTKAQVICARSKENVSVFRYFITSTWAQQAKLTVNYLAFPSMKFRKPWQIGSKYFALVGARFSEKSIRPVFSQR